MLSRRYWALKNAWSMDGLPGMQRALEAGKREGVAPIKKMVGPMAPRQYRPSNVVEQSTLLMTAVLSFMVGIFVALYFPLALELVGQRARQSARWN